MFYRTDLHELYIFNGTAWVPWRTRGYTIVVAASNSLDPTLADPAFRCDGTADQVEINAAITALGATGGAVILLDGTFAITAPVTLASNVALVGQGAGTVLRVPDGHDADLNVVYAATQNHVLVANLKIDGNTANQTAGAMHGIYWDTVTHSKIVDCWVEDMQSGYGVYLYNSSNYNTVSGNTIQGNDSTGIYLSTSSNYNTVFGNTCRGNLHGIYILSSTDNTVSGNTCQGNGNYGIMLHTSANDNTVTGNTCQGNTVDGIRISSSDNNTATGNTCQGNGDHGIYLTSSNNNTIAGNTCQGNDDGIFIYSSSDNNTISGNICQGSGDSGITLSSADYNTVTGNVCQGNIDSSGIDVVSSNNNTIAGNTCRGNGLDGITIWASSNSNTVSGNTCLENSQSADNTFDNIYLASSDYNLIVGNVCRIGGLANRPAYGIDISDNACDRNCLIGNDLYDSGATGDLNDVPVANPTLKHDNRNLAGIGWLPEV